MTMKILGIDEAGRGPVIGPMVFSGVITEDENHELLDEMKDSKLLTTKKRKELFEIIQKNFTYKIEITPPEIIDDALNSKELNLNWLEAHIQAKIINALKPDKAIIDCPSTNCKAFEDYLRKLLTKPDIELVVEHKADFNYKVVSAASILAKETRENEIDKLKKDYGDFGAGYPADPKTKEYIKKNWKKHPEIFRKTWSTYKKYSENENQKTLF